jgi:hypothetical protein
MAAVHPEPWLRALITNNNLYFLDNLRLIYYSFEFYALFYSHQTTEMDGLCLMALFIFHLKFEVF